VWEKQEIKNMAESSRPLGYASLRLKSGNVMQLSSLVYLILLSLFKVDCVLDAERLSASQGGLCPMESVTF
jgi:hypothetical protein